MRNFCWFASVLVVGCITAEVKTPTDEVEDTDAAGDDDDDTTPGPDPTGVAACAGDYSGTYDGYEQGSFDATLDAVAMRLSISDVDQSGVFNGAADVQPDGTLYGESQGYWIEGAIDLATCAMGGDWGAVALPGVPAGTWQTD